MTTDEKPHRRVRAGGPPPADDFPIQMVEPDVDPIGDTEALAIVAGIIAAIGAIVWLVVVVMERAA